MAPVHMCTNPYKYHTCYQIFNRFPSSPRAWFQYLLNTRMIMSTGLDQLVSSLSDMLKEFQKTWRCSVKMATTLKLMTLPHHHGNNLSRLYGILMRTLIREFLAQVGQKRYTSLILFWIPNRQQHSHHKSLTSIQSMRHDEFLLYG